MKAVAGWKAQGKVSYQKVFGPPQLHAFPQSGKVQAKKGIKKGTYSMKVKVSAAGNANYLSASKTVTVTVKVK